MTPLLVAAGALVAIGAAVATGARDARIASLGLAGMLVGTPFVADPLPAAAVARLRRRRPASWPRSSCSVAARRAGRAPGPPLGLAGGARRGGRGLRRGTRRDRGRRCPAAAPTPRSRRASPPSRSRSGRSRSPETSSGSGTALIVLLGGAILLMEALAGTPDPLTGIAAGVALVVLAAAAGALVGGAVSATGGTAIPDDPLAGRAAASRSGTDAPMSVLAFAAIAIAGAVVATLVRGRRHAGNPGRGSPR